MRTGVGWVAGAGGWKGAVRAGSSTGQVVWEAQIAGLASHIIHFVHEGC